MLDNITLQPLTGVFSRVCASLTTQDIVVKKNACDINVTPDKRTVLIHAEEKLKALVKQALHQIYAPSAQTSSATSACLEPGGVTIFNSIALIHPARPCRCLGPSQQAAR